MLRAHGIAVRVPLRGVGRICRTTSPPRWPTGAGSRGRCTPGCGWTACCRISRAPGSSARGSPANSWRRSWPSCAAALGCAAAGYPVPPGRGADDGRPVPGSLRAALSGGFAIASSCCGRRAGAAGPASADPRAPPRIVQHFLATDRDRATLRAGLRLARDVGRAAAPALRGGEIAPGGELAGRALDAHVAATGITVHHPLGTCRMGPIRRRAAVVDAELRVQGVEGCGSSTPR